MSAVDTMIHCAGCGHTSPWKPQYAGRKLRCKCGHVIQVQAAPVEVIDPELPQIVDEYAPAEASSIDDLLAAAVEASSAPLSAPTANPFDDADPPPRLKPSADAFSPGQEPAADDFGAYGLAPTPAIPITRRPTAESYDPADDDDDDDVQPARSHSAATAVASPILAYKSFQRRRNTDEEDQIVAYQRKEMILPAILIAVGLLATFVEARVAIGEFDMVAMSVFVAFSTVVNLVLIFAALLMASKLLDLGLGEVGPALLKVAAVAILPSAVGGVILASTGFMGGMLAWAVTLALYFLLLYNLFEMDSQEMMITAVIIWFVRTWVAYFIIMAVLGTGSFDDEDDSAIPNQGGGGGQWVAPGTGDDGTSDPDDPDAPDADTAPDAMPSKKAPKTMPAEDDGGENNADDGGENNADDGGDVPSQSSLTRPSVHQVVT